MKIILALTTIMLCIALNPVFADEKAGLYYAQMHACEKTEDCVQAPEVFSSCFHYCKDKECASAKTCPLFNRHFKNFPDCARNVPCISNSDDIACVNKVCVRKMR